MADATATNSIPLWGVFARCYFSILIFLGVTIGMSLINSIFVDAMTDENNDEVLEKLNLIEKEIKEVSNKS